MSDRNIPVTEDELHAYVDNVLPAQRRGDVEAWLIAHPYDAERVRSWRAMAEAQHARYDAVADEPVPKRLDVERLLPGPTGPASFLMYESASGERFTIYTGRTATQTTQMRYAKQDNDGALFWADRGVGYVVSDGGDRERVTQVARLVY